MYQVEFTPMAREAIYKITDYIKTNLKNEDASNRLMLFMRKAAENIGTFPYAHTAFKTIKSTKYELRRIIVQNYAMFYIVDEENKVVTITAVKHESKRVKGILK